MPRDEPTALPAAYSEWEEWRNAYAGFVADFKNSDRRASDVLQLRIKLKRLGYYGVRLDDEIRYVQETATCG